MRRFLRFLFCLLFHVPLTPWVIASVLIAYIGNALILANKIDYRAQRWIVNRIYLPAARQICSDDLYGRDMD